VEVLRVCSLTLQSEHFRPVMCGRGTSVLFKRQSDYLRRVLSGRGNNVYFKVAE
jgi:hypothetical protein